jgi:hypothetical protein
LSLFEDGDNYLASGKSGAFLCLIYLYLFWRHGEFISASLF